MPYANEHACRLSNPSEFVEESYTRGSRVSGGKKYSILFAQPKGGGGRKEQAYRYKRSVWTAAQARAHCQRHNGSFEAAIGQGKVQQAEILMVQKYSGYPAWSSVNKSELPRGAFLVTGDPDEKSSWKLPYKFVQDGKLAIHPGGVLAMWQAINGAHTGQSMSISSSLKAKARVLYERHWGKKKNGGQES
jgi:hypothetical protein